MMSDVALDPRARNRQLQDAEIESGAKRLSARPTRVWFALTGRCNLACQHCPRIAGVSSDEDMEHNVFDKVRDEVLPLAEEVDFGGNNLGEQMIHPEFFKALAEIRKAGCEVQLTTNGTKLNAQTAPELAKQGVRLRISVEGMGEMYEQVRRVSWDKLVTGLRAFQQAANEHPEACSSLEFAMTAFADNVHQVPEMVSLAKELGARRLLVQHLLPKSDQQKLQSLFFHRKTANDTFERTQKLADDLGVAVSLPKPLDMGTISLLKKPAPADAKPAEAAPEPAAKKLPPCYLPWTSINVLENGDVLPCCVAGGSLIMGNLKKSSFEDVWNGPAYQRLRQTVNSDKPHPVCAGCAMRGGSATEESYDILLDDRSIANRVKAGVKEYLLRTKRKKTLAMLVNARDSMTRLRARF